MFAVRNRLQSIGDGLYSSSQCLKSVNQLFDVNREQDSDLPKHTRYMYAKEIDRGRVKLIDSNDSRE